MDPFGMSYELKMIGPNFFYFNVFLFITNNLYAS
jgi:hypothetical protein